MYLMIGMWGGENRFYATVKFIVYTMAGSALMLVAILALHVLHLSKSRAFSSLFDFFGLDLSLQPAEAPVHGLLSELRHQGAAVPVPHLAARRAHRGADGRQRHPGGVLLKMGGYGFIRFCLPLFPAAATAFAPLIAVLAVVGILYGALVAMVQPDIKRLVAYSSVSHLGLVMLGIFAGTWPACRAVSCRWSITASPPAPLFLLVGMIYDRRHTRLIADYGGLWRQMRCSR